MVPPDSKAPLKGRCISVSTQSLVLRNEHGQWTLPMTGETGAKPGDILSWDGALVKVLTPNRSTTPGTSWIEHVLDPRRLHAMEIRNQVEGGIRRFFTTLGFRETRTPLLVPCPGMEPHIRPLNVDGGAYLPTSPEFAMKRLLVGGLEKIFQISPAFRSEPVSRTHHPEFTMLEWYRAYSGWEQIMQDTESLLESLALAIYGEPAFSYEGRKISVKTPWPRLRIRDLFWQHCEVDLTASSTRERLSSDCKRLGIQTSAEDTWDDLYFRIWLNLIEPRLPSDRAVLVTHYPASQAALAVVETSLDGSRWARRFEAYAGGLELGNAFEELTDPIEQRRRFIEDMELRQKTYGSSFPPNPIDEEFLEALAQGMPPSAGIAMGVDRLVMLLANETDIEKTIWLRSYQRAP